MIAAPHLRAADYPGPGARETSGDSDRQGAQAVVGLRFFLAVVSSLFFLLVVAWLMRAQYDDWEALSQPWQPLASPWQLWLNTFALVSASIFLQIARQRARVPAVDAARVKFATGLGGLCSVLFLAGQLWLWHNLNAAGFGVAANPANSFFYLITGLHGLHLFGGVLAWGRLQFSRTQTPARLRLGTELCAIYWHYLLFIWLLVFGLLISPPATFAAIASFCGFSP